MYFIKTIEYWISWTVPSIWLPSYFLSALLPTLSYFQSQLLPFCVFTDKNGLGMGWGAGVGGRGCSERFCFLMGGFIITQMLGLWVNKAGGGDVTGFRQCSASSTPTPTMGLMRALPVPRLEVGVTASGLPLSESQDSSNHAWLLPLPAVAPFNWLKSHPSRDGDGVTKLRLVSIFSSSHLAHISS